MQLAKLFALNVNINEFSFGVNLKMRPGFLPDWIKRIESFFQYSNFNFSFN